MKQNILNAIVFFLIGAFSGGIIVSAIDADRVKKNEQAIIDSSRASIIEFNKECNKTFNNLLFLAFSDNDDYARTSAQVLQHLFPKLQSVNKSLKLDCTKYENGAPVLIQDQNGKSSPLEILPEEIKLIE